MANVKNFQLKKVKYLPSHEIPFKSHNFNNLHFSAIIPEVVMLGRETKAQDNINALHEK